MKDTQAEELRALPEIEKEIDDLLLQFTKGYGALTVTFSGSLGEQNRVFQMPYAALKNAILHLLHSHQQELLETVEVKISKLVNLGEYEEWGTYGEGFEACLSEVKNLLQDHRQLSGKNGKRE